MGSSQSKCSYCEGRTDSSHSGCDAPSWCTCDCNIGGGHDVAQKTAAVTGGVGAVVGGVLLTVFTGGVGGLVAGGVALGVGVSSATNGITAITKKEKMNAASYFIDTGVGAVGGVLTGGAGGAAAQCATTGGKIAAGAVLGAVAGTGTSALGEEANVEKHRLDGDNEYKYNVHAIWAGAATGALGGAAVGASGAMANKAADALGGSVTRGVTKAVTRATTDAVVGVGDSAIRQGARAAAGEEFDGNALWKGALSGAVGSAISSTSRNLDDKAASVATNFNLSRGAGKAVSRVTAGAVSGVTKAGISAIGNKDDNLSSTLIMGAVTESAAYASENRATKERKERRVDRKIQRWIDKSEKNKQIAENEAFAQCSNGMMNQKYKK